MCYTSIPTYLALFLSAGQCSLVQGVISASQVSLGRTGGIAGDCPLCTEAWTCAVCAHLGKRSSPTDVPSDLGVVPFELEHETYETLVADSESTGFSHIKVSSVGSSSAPQIPVDSDFEAAIRGTMKKYGASWEDVVIRFEWQKTYEAANAENVSVNQLIMV